jgi:DNA-binding MarR family transcriptional regulator
MLEPKDVDADLPLLMIRAAKAMVAEMDADAGGPNAAGFTAMHAIAARYIAASSEVTSVQIAEHLHITKQSASEIINLFEVEGIVRRHPHPTDGRARVVELTDEGVEGVARSRARWGVLVDRWSALVDADDLDVVRRALEAYLAEADSR